MTSVGQLESAPGGGAPRKSETSVTVEEELLARRAADEAAAQSSLARQRINWLLYAAIIVVGLALAVGSIPLAAVGGLLGAAAFGRDFPRRGMVAASAAALLWSNAAIVLPDRLGLPVVIGLLPQVMLASVVVGRLLARRLPLVSTFAFRMLLLHGAALAMAGIVALENGPVLDSLISFVAEGVILWFLVINAIDGESEVRLATIAVVTTSAAVGLLSVAQFATGTFDNDYLGFAQVGDTRVELLDQAAETGDDVLLRLSGPIGEQNRYAQALLVIVPLALALARGGRTTRRYWALLAVLPIVSAIALTGSRGAVLGFVAVLVVMAYLRLVSPQAVAVVLLAGMLAVSVLPGYRDRVLSAFTSVQGLGDESAEVDGSTLSRVTQNLAAAHMFVDHPIFGVGPAGYPEQYERYAERVGLRVKDQTRQPHNLILGTAAESGLVGLVTFVAAPAAIVYRLERVRRKARGKNQRRAALAAGYISAIAAYMATGVFLHLAFERYYWMLLALADAAARSSDNAQSVDDSAVAQDLVPAEVTA